MSDIKYRDLLVGNQIVRRKRWDEQPSHFDSDRHRELYDVICESSPALNVPISGRLLREWIDRTSINDVVDADVLDAYKRERLIDGAPTPLAPEHVIPALWPPGLGGSYGSFHWKASAWAMAREIAEREER
jgi:hypothetical protein